MMKPSKGAKFVALCNSYGFQGRYWKKGDTGVVTTEKEAEGMPEKQFRCFTASDVDADKAAKEKADQKKKDAAAAKQAAKDADKEAKEKAKADAKVKRDAKAKAKADKKGKK